MKRISSSYEQERKQIFQHGILQSGLSENQQARRRRTQAVRMTTYHSRPVCVSTMSVFILWSRKKWAEYGLGRWFRQVHLQPSRLACVLFLYFFSWEALSRIFPDSIAENNSICQKRPNTLSEMCFLELFCFMSLCPDKRRQLPEGSANSCIEGLELVWPA